MTFFADKKNCMDKLALLDKSRAGKVDMAIADAVRIINSLESYFTTSSCAGRLLVLEEPIVRQKNKVSWVYCSHDTVVENDLRKAIVGSDKINLWMHLEYPIIHICAKTIDDAKILLCYAEKCGLRHCGITSVGKKIIVEIIAQEKLDVPLAHNREYLLKESAISYLINLYNAKIEKTREKINNFSLLLKKDCK